MQKKKNKKVIRKRKNGKLEFDKILEKARREGKLTCKNLCP